ncbi:MAG: class I SAM-dependent methyltransferase, partial [Bdellovibrionales bacterium]|nr:class I SAM-dependent methyltransferase [Bdellovibrionales bacterium]
MLKKRAIGLHRNFNDEPITWAITDEVINFLLDNLNPHMKTLETGIGLSTFAFGVSETHHSVLSYNEDEVQRFKEICRTNNWSFHKMEFYLERSELILPQLPRRPDYDLILIDGGHGFPTPYIDWFYSSSLLKTGGFMILDDIQLPIVFKLYQFLCEHPHWQLEKNYLWQSAIFRKISPQAGYRVEDWYHHNWLKRPHWPRWMIYTFWVPLSGNTATHKRLSHLLDFIFVRHFFSPLYYH